MKRFLTVTAAAALLANPVRASSDSHTKCAQVADYAGCMAFQTGAVASTDSTSALRTALKQVAARLRAGTSLRDSTLTFQPVTDALAVADQSTETAKKVTKAAALFEAYQLAWSTRIDHTAYSMNQYATDGYKFYGCKALKLTSDNFDSLLGYTAIGWSYKKGLLGSHVCRVKAHQLPEDYMRPIVIRALEDAAIDPKVLAAQKAAAAERRRLCALGPWKRRLESNPGLQAWAKANPALAEAQKKKFLSDPKNQTSC